MDNSFDTSQALDTENDEEHKVNTTTDNETDISFEIHESDHRDGDTKVEKERNEKGDHNQEEGKKEKDSPKEGKREEKSEAKAKPRPVRSKKGGDESLSIWKNRVDMAIESLGDSTEERICMFISENMPEEIEGNNEWEKSVSNTLTKFYAKRKTQSSSDWIWGKSKQDEDQSKKKRKLNPKRKDNQTNKKMKKGDMKEGSELPGHEFIDINEFSDIEVNEKNGSSSKRSENSKSGGNESDMDTDEDDSVDGMINGIQTKSNKRVVEPNAHENEDIDVVAIDENENDLKGDQEGSEFIEIKEYEDPEERDRDALSSEQAQEDDSLSDEYDIYGLDDFEEDAYHDSDEEFDGGFDSDRPRKRTAPKRIKNKPQRTNSRSDRDRRSSKESKKIVKLL